MRVSSLLLCLVAWKCNGFLSPKRKHCNTASTSRSEVSSTLYFSRSNDVDDEKSDDTEAWDANVDYEKEWPKDQSPPDPSSAWDALPNMPDAPRLGIDLQLKPLSEEEAQLIKEEASDIINQKIDAGIEDIEKLRTKMAKELDSQRKVMQVASELQAKQKSEELMSKIDKLAGNFLDSTKETRTSTKMAAAASRAMEGTSRGIEMGTWGTLGGRTIVAGSIDNDILLGSVANAERDIELKDKRDGKSDEESLIENRIVILADTKQDPYAKQLVPALIEKLEATNIPNLQLDVLSPTATMPLGGNNAACIVTMCTSISQGSSLKLAYDRLLRKTLQADGKVGRPPTQLVGISTVGTERTDKFPYSLSNMLGKLDQRRQVEEALVNTVKQRVTEPPLDYTLIKLGELKSSAKEFALSPGDILDDPTTPETAAEAIVQAVAYQPFARNATLCLSGALPLSMEEEEYFWDTTFLCLDGPEVWRSEDDIGDASSYGQLLEYIQGWANLLATSGKGLTTPVQAIPGISSTSSHLVEEQEGVQLLFLSTKTGKNYMSREEERQREVDQVGRAAPSNVSPRKIAKEGGIDVVVEITKEQKLRVRARRCNYADDAVIKELSEGTIVKRLQDAMDVWTKEKLG